MNVSARIFDIQRMYGRDSRQCTVCKVEIEQYRYSVVIIQENFKTAWCSTLVYTPYEAVPCQILHLIVIGYSV